MNARYAQCPDCPKVIGVKKDGTIRPHGHPANRCTGSGFFAVDWPTYTNVSGKTVHAVPRGGAR